MTSPRKRVVSGMRPTGPLHIGHYFGALANWVKMQDEYKCFYFVADWHALTSDYALSSLIYRNSLEIAIDWLAVGLDPNKSTFFLQSLVPEHAELFLLLSMITPLGWLERVPTYKEQMDNVEGKDLRTYGFLGYPVLQSADIVIYQADLVPVGEDQVAHVELTREIVRKFNFHYGLSISRDILNDPDRSLKNLLTSIVGKSLSLTITRPDDRDLMKLQSEIKQHMNKVIAEVGPENFIESLGVARKYIEVKKILSEPRHLLTETPRIPGTDGRKMSKSYGNAIMLGEDNESIRSKVRGMKTDPARIHRDDKGNPDVCPVFAWHKLFSPQFTINRVNNECRTAEIGCVDCKRLMADSLIAWIEPIRSRRLDYQAHPERVREILGDGSAKARQIARQTMMKVREAIFGEDSFSHPRKKRRLKPKLLNPSGAGN